MKKFKNSFGVKGSPSLLQALKEEVEKLGWKYDKDFNSGYSKRNPDLYFNANKPKDAMKPQHFSFSNVGNCIIYNLPEQWDECLKAASELVEEIPEVELEEPMEIAGYSVKFEDDKVSVGCYKDITLKDLKTMKKAIKVASKFGKDLTITEDSVIDNTEDSAIFLDEIEQLIERLDG